MLLGALALAPASTAAAAEDVNTHAEGLDAAPSAGGRIAGVVTAAQTGEPLDGILVCLVESPMKTSPHCIETATDGSYVFENLTSGSYEVAFSPEREEIWGAPVHEVEEEIGEALLPPDGYAAVWWNSQGDSSSATPIVLTAPEAVSGIDGSIGPVENWTLISQRVVIPPPTPPAPVVYEANPPLSLPSRTPTTAKPVTATKPPKKPQALACKRGFVKRKARGKERCVKRSKVVHRAKGKRPKRSG